MFECLRYMIRVQTRNEAGWSPESEPFAFSTSHIGERRSRNLSFTFFCHICLCNVNLNQNSVNLLKMFHSHRPRALVAENVPKELQSRAGDEDMTVMADPPKLQVSSAAASPSWSWSPTMKTVLSLTLILVSVLR